MTGLDKAIRAYEGIFAGNVSYSSLSVPSSLTVAVGAALNINFHKCLQRNSFRVPQFEVVCIPLSIEPV